MEINLFYLVFAVVTFTLLYHQLTKNNDYFNHKPIPSLDVRPLLGSTGPVTLKRTSLPEFIVEIYNKFPSAKIFGMFDATTPVFVVRDPEWIKRIAVTDFDHFVDHQAVVGSGGADPDSNMLFGNSLVAMTGDRWKRMRALLSPAFTGSKMRQMFQLVVECCGSMEGYFLEEVAMNGGCLEINVKDALSRVGINVIASCAFGLQVDTLKEPEHEFLRQGKKMVDFGRLSVAVKMFALRLFPNILGGLGLDIIDREQTEYFTNLIKNTIRKRQDQGVERNDMIDLLLHARRGEGLAATDTMTENEMIAQCCIFFAAGFNSVSTSATFLIYELAKNPEVQGKLYQEVLQTFKTLNGESPSYDDLQQMKYLDMVVSESLRMWSPAPMVDRLCVRDYVIDDGSGLRFTIYKDTCVWIPAHGLHHDPKYFPEPERFDPERFCEESKWNIVPGSYLPFGIGPRNCIGSRFALMEVKAIMYYLLLKFSFEKSDRTDAELRLKKGSYSLDTEVPIQVKICKRDP